MIICIAMITRGEYILNGIYYSPENIKYLYGIPRLHIQLKNWRRNEKCDVCCCVHVWELLRHGLADGVVGDHPLLVDLPLTEELLHLLHRQPLPQGCQHFPQLSCGNPS